jgi:excisionase family DNA binding protein
MTWQPFQPATAFSARPEKPEAAAAPTVHNRRTSSRTEHHVHAATRLAPAQLARREEEDEPPPMARNNPIRIVLTVAEAAEILGIGRTLMYSLVTSGAVESVTIGRLRRIPSDALSAYVQALRNQTATGVAA